MKYLNKLINNGYTIDQVYGKVIRVVLLFSVKEREKKEYYPETKLINNNAKGVAAFLRHNGSIKTIKERKILKRYNKYSEE